MSKKQKDGKDVVVDTTVEVEAPVVSQKETDQNSFTESQVEAIRDSYKAKMTQIAKERDDNFKSLQLAKESVEKLTKELAKEKEEAQTEKEKNSLSSEDKQLLTSLSDFLFSLYRESQNTRVRTNIQTWRNHLSEMVGDSDS